MTRLFAAVWPSAPVVEVLAALDRPSLPGLRWSTPDQWHVTLRFFGNVTDAQRPALDASWRALDLDGLAPVDATLGPATARLGDGILQVPVAGLDDLAALVTAATADVGEPPGPRPFHGHLTLARVGRPRVDLRALTGRPLSAAWVVSEVTLVRSDTRSTGARYEVIDRRSLS